MIGDRQLELNAAVREGLRRAHCTPVDALRILTTGNGRSGDLFILRQIRGAWLDAHCGGAGGLGSEPR